MKALALSGSLRSGSYNTKVLKIAIDIAKKEGMEVDEISAVDMDIPLFNEDIEAQGYPDKVKKIFEKVDKGELLIIASPEYNRSITGTLKNFIDWLSRDGNHLDGKTAIIFGASMGGFGTITGQLHLRQILARLNVMVYPQPRFLLSYAQNAFDESDQFKEEENLKNLKNLITATINKIK